MAGSEVIDKDKKLREKEEPQATQQPEINEEKGSENDKHHNLNTEATSEISPDLQQPHAAVGNQLSSYLQYYHHYGTNPPEYSSGPTHSSTTGNEPATEPSAPNHEGSVPEPNPASNSGFYTYRNPSFQYNQTDNNGPAPTNYQFKSGRPKTKTDELKITKFAVKKPAKDKDTKKHDCTFPGCKWSFSRLSDLRRHAKSHSEPLFHCPYWNYDPTCHRNGGAFNRLDVLRRHLKLVHYVIDKQQLVPSSSKADPGWCRTCQRMFPTSKVFIDHCLGCAQQLTPAEWKPASGDPKPEQEDNARQYSDETQPSQYPEPASNISQPQSNYQELAQANHANQLYEISRINSQEKAEEAYLIAPDQEPASDRKLSDLDPLK